MKNLKKIVALLTVSLFLLSFSNCGGAKTDDSKMSFECLKCNINVMLQNLGMENSKFMFANLLPGQYSAMNLMLSIKNQ